MNPRQNIITIIGLTLIGLNYWFGPQRATVRNNLLSGSTPADPANDPPMTHRPIQRNDAGQAGNAALGGIGAVVLGQATGDAQPGRYQ